MRYSFISLALAALATASDVTDLNKDNFKDFISSNDLVLAECRCICHWPPSHC
jgi:hypothetical protein